MQYKKTAKRIAALLLTVILLLSVPSFMPASTAQALDYTTIEAKLNTWQYYMCRTVMSLSLKDYYDTGVLPSITAGQFFFEGGCAGAPISIIAQNHFGIKMHTWDGKVFDHGEDIVYNSYADLVNLKGSDYAKNASLWRAYDSLEESIADHSNLLLTQSRYTEVLAAKTYTEAAYALVEAGYASSSTYASNLINYIELYDFDQLDTVTYDENGVFGMVMDVSRANLAVGESRTLTATAYPTPETAVDAVWASADPTVATVDENGVVTALRQGYTLITATYNSKEACCIVSVDTNGYVMNKNLAIMSEPNADSDALGKLVRGQPVKINSETVFTDEDGTAYYAVSASVGSKSIPVSGYASAANIHIDTQAKLSIGTPTTVFYVDPAETFTVPIEIYAEELQGVLFDWHSSDPSVLSVTQDGTVTAVSEGVAVVSVSIDGRVALTVTVYVGDAAYEELTANAAVYLRDAPTTGANILGTIRQGETVKLILEPENGWYKILATINGQTMEGYSYSRYFNRAGEETSGAESSKAESSETASSGAESSGSGSSNEGSYESSFESSRESSDPTSGGGDNPFYITYPTGAVNVDDSLNVRDAAGMSGNKIAKLGNGDEVIILDSVHLENESVYKDWYRIRFTYKGAETEGYVCAEYILLTGTVDIPIDTPPEPVSDLYTVEELYITEIPEKTALQVFTDGFEQTVRVFRADGTELGEDDILHTGDEVRFYIGNTVYTSRIAAVKGDANGDGLLNATDYIIVKRTVLGTYRIEGAFLRAAAVTDGVKVTAADYIKIKRVVLGTYRFF